MLSAKGATAYNFSLKLRLGGLCVPERKEGYINHAREYMPEMHKCTHANCVKQSYEALHSSSRWTDTSETVASDYNAKWMTIKRSRQHMDRTKGIQGSTRTI